MNAEAAALVRRRARNLFVFLPLAAIIISVAATQFVAWRLGYYSSWLGDPIVAHAYYPWRFLQWWQAPWEAQVDSTFQYLKFGMLATVCLGAVLALKARTRQPMPQPTIHGTAGIATEEEIRACDLFPRGQPGIIVGGWTDRRGHLHYLTDTGEGHFACLGATRAGKTQGTLVTTLLSHGRASFIVNDPKGEVWQMTAGWRSREAGNIVMRFAPAELTNTVAWNPIDRARIGTPYQFRDVANIVQQVADPHGKGFHDHWEPTGANFILGVALYLVETSYCTFSGVLSAMDANADVETLLKAMADHPTQYIAEAGRGMLGTPQRERGSIISTARRQLSLFRDPVLAKNTSHSDFRIEDLVQPDRPVTLYIETRGEDELRLRPLVRLFLTVALGQLISGDGPNKQPLVVAIDELPSLRKMETIEMFLTKAAGANIRMMLLAQDFQDIVAEYGEHERITAHCSTLVAHAANNDKSADWLSHRTGQGTVVVEEVSESSQPGGRRTQNRTFRSVPRPVLTPDEIKRLKQPRRNAVGRIVGPGELLVFHAGMHVIRGTQSLAFLNPEFSRRMAIPAPPTMRMTAPLRHGPTPPGPYARMEYAMPPPHAATRRILDGAGP